MKDSAQHLESGEATGDSRNRILDVAEQLYMERGYRAVSLRDIANALSIKQASLYYHFPDGKEQLFEAVVERAMLRHKAGIEAVVAAQLPNIRRQLLAVIEWFNSQPPMNFTAMMHTDMPALRPERTKALEVTAHRALFEPLFGIVIQAMQRGEIRPINPAMMAGMMLAVLSGLEYGLRQVAEAERPRMIEEVVDLLLQGLYPR
ncbi:MAG: TetR/AcrR family transcriptional regulator [Caldilineaceae bacterium]